MGAIRDKGADVLNTEHTECNLCGSSERRLLYTEAYSLNGVTVDLGIVQCRKCQLVYVSPRLTLESTAYVYAHDAQHTISHEYCWDGSADARRFRRLLARLSVLAPRGRLLDVGCGGGHLLAEAARMNRWELIGVDPSDVAIQQTRHRVGCPVYATTLEDAPLEPASCDVVTMLGVLEHLHDPSGTLRRAGELMTGEGILAVYVPNFSYLRLKDAGLLGYLRKGRWSNLHPQEHVHQYTPKTLRAMLERSGFDPLHFDIGHPFLHGSWWNSLVKRAAYSGVCALKVATGLHLGGLEVIARYRKPRVHGAVEVRQNASSKRDPQTGVGTGKQVVHPGVGIPAAHTLSRNAPEHATR